MTRDDIKRMAQEAGMRESGNGDWTAADAALTYPECVYTENLERFAHLVAAAEREACAKVVEIEEARVFELRDKLEEAPAPYLTGKSIACIQIAAAIRAKGQE